MEKNRFDRKAAEWDKKQRRRELAEAVAQAVAELPLSTDMTAMDFGCGTGLVSLPLAPKLGMIVAVDSSEGMIGVLNEKISREQIDNIKTHVGEITNASFSHHFDLIFTSMTLHHIEDTDSVLDRFRDLLPAGGLLAIADLDAEDGSFHKPGSGEKHHGFDRHRLEKALGERGFSNVSFKTVHQITRTTEDGGQKAFKVFLATAEKQ